MTAMTGDKGGVIYDPPPCMNKVAEYFGTIRVNKKYNITNQTRPMKIVKSIFLIEKQGFNNFLKIRGVQI